MQIWAEKNAGAAPKHFEKRDVNSPKTDKKSNIIAIFVDSKLLVLFRYEISY